MIVAGWPNTAPQDYAPWFATDGVAFRPDVVVLGLCLNDMAPVPMLAFPAPEVGEPWLGGASVLASRLQQALAARDAAGAVAALLTLEASIVEWSRDTLQGDDLDRARAALRAMVVRLGAAATDGVRDVRDVVGPVVEAALAARVAARADKAFGVSDAIRDNLAAAGIEVRDTPDGVEWSIAGPANDVGA